MAHPYKSNLYFLSEKKQNVVNKQLYGFGDVELERKTQLKWQCDGWWLALHLGYGLVGYE